MNRPYIGRPLNFNTSIFDVNTFANFQNKHAVPSSCLRESFFRQTEKEHNRELSSTNKCILLINFRKWSKFERVTQ